MSTLTKTLAWAASVLALLVGFAGVRCYGLIPKSRPAASVSAPRTPEAIERAATSPAASAPA